MEDKPRKHRKRKPTHVLALWWSENKGATQRIETFVTSRNTRRGSGVIAWTGHSSRYGLRRRLKHRCELEDVESRVARSLLQRHANLNRRIFSSICSRVINAELNEKSKSMPPVPQIFVSSHEPKPECLNKGDAMRM